MVYNPPPLNRSYTAHALMTLKRLLTPRAAFALIALAYALYAGAFIYRTSAYIEANSYIRDPARYYVLFDDAMISMRYANNLANGDGLVWNPGGERVEGFTNPAWVGYMALFHLFEIPATQTSLYIQASGALFLLANLWVVKRIADLLVEDGTGYVPEAPSRALKHRRARVGSQQGPLMALPVDSRRIHPPATPGGADRAVSYAALAGLGAALFTAFYLPLNTWSLQGTEVSLLTLVMSLAALWTLRALRAGRFSLAPYLLLGASTWVRLDMAVPFGALAVFLVINDPAHRRRHLVAAPLVLAAFMAPQFAARRWYYGEWLPNTYALKVEGYPLVKRVTHGYEIAWRFVVRWGVWPLGIFLFRRDRGVRLLAWLFLGQLAYNVWTGGDAWEHYGGANRYLSIAMPLLFVLLWLTLTTFYGWLIALRSRTGSGPPPGAARVGLAVMAGALLLSYNYTYGTGAYKEWLLIEPSLYAGENGQKVRMAKLLDALTTEEATVALAGAGIIPYFTDRPYIDLLGKNDPTIAHLPADQQHIPEFKPGHMKWDYAYSIGTLQPDVVLELWVRAQDAAPYLDEAYQPVWFPPKNDVVWMRAESPRVRWERIRGE